MRLTFTSNFVSDNCENCQSKRPARLFLIPPAGQRFWVRSEQTQTALSFSRAAYVSQSVSRLA